MRILHKISFLSLLLLLGCTDTSEFTDSTVLQKDMAADLEEDVQLVVPDGMLPPDSTCAYFSTQAKQTPTAMMIVLDRSSSMSTNSKWNAAQQAIIKAIDSPAFDNMSLGLLAYPAFMVAAPKCLFLVPQVSCGTSALPQVPLKDSGINKTTGTSGPRKDIYTWLASNGPDTTKTDASPGYDALNAAIKALQNYNIKGKRLVLFITDGGFSCASVSSPTRPGYTDGLCPDWEYPDSVIALLKNAAHHAREHLHHRGSRLQQHRQDAGALRHRALPHAPGPQRLRLRRLLRHREPQVHGKGLHQDRQ